MNADFDAARLNKVFADLQSTVQYQDRPTFAQLLINATNGALPADWRRTPSPSIDSMANALKTEGLVRLGRLLEPQHAAALVRYFAERPCLEGQVPNKSAVRRTIAECQAAQINHGSYPLADVLAAPFLIETANRQDILDLVETYLGCTPTLYSMNAFWTFPKPSHTWAGIQTYHRDYDDFRFCTIFLFLTETTVGNGAHHFLRGTHRTDLVQKIVAEKLDALRRENRGAPERVPNFDIRTLYSTTYPNLNAECALFFPDLVETVVAEPGSAVIEDTYGLHKGDVPVTPRLVVWMRYGLYRNTANVDDKIVPVPRSLVAGRIPDTDYHKWVNRLVVEPVG